MVTLHLKKDEVARGQRDQFFGLIKSSLRLSWISYIGKIHKTTSINKRIEWK